MSIGGAISLPYPVLSGAVHPALPFGSVSQHGSRAVLSGKVDPKSVNIA
jgi:hypothetical protein